MNALAYGAGQRGNDVTVGNAVFGAVTGACTLGIFFMRDVAA
ncbi:MAG: hypothetical protein ACTTKL_06185 [Treponema sp.]